MTLNEIERELGNTPLQRLGETNLYVKLEGFNPAGSIKDRTAFYMIKGAIEKGLIKEGYIGKSKYMYFNIWDVVSLYKQELENNPYKLYGIE